MNVIKLDAAQRGVLKGVVAGLVLTIGTITLAIALWPREWIPTDQLMQRVSFALRYDLALLLCLIVAIGALARYRFFSSADIDGSGLSSATQKAAVLQAILQNTLEQVVVAFVTHIAWAFLMPIDWQGAIPVAVLLFVIGRALFAMNYGRGAAARALGFALTFYPTVLMALIMLGVEIGRV